MGKAKIILTILFVLTLSSGLVAGMLVSRFPGVKPGTAVARTPLAEELGLTQDQNEKMRVIWEGVKGKVDECFQSAQSVQKKRDDAVLGLLTDEQKVKFARIQANCSEALASLKTERDGAFDVAVKETETFLTEVQKLRYREILQNRLHHGRHQGGAGAAPDWLTPGVPGVKGNGGL